jgi:hypothetical protein
MALGHQDRLVLGRRKHPVELRPQWPGCIHLPPKPIANMIVEWVEILPPLIDSVHYLTNAALCSKIYHCKKQGSIFREMVREQVIEKARTRQSKLKCALYSVCPDS